MSAEEQTQDAGGSADAYRIGEGGVWANAWKVMAVLAAVGIAGAVVGALSDPERFAFSYLFAFAVAMTLAMGGLFLVFVQFLTAAGWGISVRRTAEFVMAGTPVLALLVIPVLASHGTLYEWAHVGHGEHEDEHGDAEGEPHGDAGLDELIGVPSARAQDHGEDVGHPKGAEHTLFADMSMEEHTPMEEALHHELLAFKTSTWYTTGFWIARSIGYLAIWILLALTYFRWSTKQDRTRDPQLTVRMQKLAPVAAILFGLTLTFAGFDWVMSLEPVWYSTIYGVYLFAGSAMAIFALVIVITLSQRDHGLLGNAVNVEHYHDLGKLMFGFVCFWAYVAFSQWMLIWYASIPEETTYYHRRWSDGWQVVSMLLILGHFAAPFLYLISRVPKRKLAMLKAGAAWLLFMHVVDMYWFVMPYAGGAFSPHWLDVACLFAVVGLFFSVVFFVMRKYPLLPIGDPRLARALHHHQTQ
ncbi:MAG: hypothetical protein ACOC97_02235 [Myxococcota bacterium]